MNQITLKDELWRGVWGGVLMTDKHFFHQRHVWWNFDLNFLIC